MAYADEIAEEESTVSEWGDWSACSVSCGAGIEISRRTMLDNSVPNMPLLRTRACAGIPCTIANMKTLDVAEPIVAQTNAPSGMLYANYFTYVVY